MSDLKEKTEEIIDGAENLADNIAHPDHETRKEARKRQRLMPIIGVAAVALVLFIAYAVFYR